MANTPKKVDFKLFAAAKNANVLTNASYFASPSIGPGVKEGVAMSALYNKTMRQLSLISVGLATYLSQRLDEDVVDDGTIDTLIDQISRAIGKQAIEDVPIPIGTLLAKGIVQFSKNYRDPNTDDRAATIGCVGALEERVALLEKMVNNTWTPISNKPYNPILDTFYPVGTTVSFNNGVDPNKKYPGTTWAKIPDECSLRTSKGDGTDLGGVFGKNSFTLNANQLPSHAHGINLTSGNFDYGTKTTNPTDLGTIATTAHDHGVITTTDFDYGTKTTSTHNADTITTSSFDYGTKGTNTTGNHTHNINLVRGVLQSNANSNTNEGVWGNQETTPAGDHSHTVFIGAHTHTVPIASHVHTVNIGVHNHSVTIGAHNHNVILGQHTHTVVIGAHTHAIVGNTLEVGSGYPISLISQYYGLNAWVRTK